MEEFKQDYVAFKVMGLTHWVWFATKNITRNSNGEFVCKGGWGKGGAFTEMTIDPALIIGKIESTCLQYN